MGRGIIKLENPDYGPDEQPEYYLIWSTVVDAPITYGMSLDELEKWIRDEYGRSGMRDLINRLERVEETGTSFHRDTLEGVLCVNRAGVDDEGNWTEEHISEREILERYCLNPPAQDDDQTEEE